MLDSSWDLFGRVFRCDRLGILSPQSRVHLLLAGFRTLRRGRKSCWIPCWGGTCALRSVVFPYPRFHLPGL